MNEKRFLGKSRFAGIGKKNWNERRGKRRKVKRKDKETRKSREKRRERKEDSRHLQTTYPCQEVTRKQERFQ